MNVKQSIAHSKHLINIMSPLIHLYSHLVPGYKFLIDEQHSKKRLRTRPPHTWKLLVKAEALAVGSRVHCDRSLRPG